MAETAENVKKKKEEDTGGQGAAKVAVGAADLRIAAGEYEEGTWRRGIYPYIKGVSLLLPSKPQASRFTNLILRQKQNKRICIDQLY